MIMSSLSAILFATLLATPAPGAQPAEKTFESPQRAADAFLAAVSSDDVAALVEMFGPSGKKIVSSGDDVKDKNDRAKVAERAREKMDVTVDEKNPHRAIIALGANAWPFPVPIVETSGKWHFAGQEGLREILMRRIGQDELDAIQVCHGYVEAQQEYASEAREVAGVHMYAERILSTPGKKDGLAWYDADGKPAGPIGDEVAKAIEEGYTSRHEPYHGYFFRILKAQGPAARHGELNYVIQGKMVGGFALVAWPAAYRVSGVQTFIVNHEGVVYEKDLGPDTAKIAPAMRAYNPDKTWRPVPEADH